VELHFLLQEMKGENEATLGDYKVESLRTILLMVLMYAIPRDFNHVTFDLSWGFPDQKCDALDASCLIFSGKSCVGIVDYCQTEYGKTAKAIWHSGDAMDQVKKTGRHTVDAKLKEIPSSVTHLYFTLSAWNSPTIAHYLDPCLKFFEASNKEYNLCPPTTFTHALDSQAIIMCSVVRHKDQWKIFACGQCSKGNAKDYEPLKTSIQKLIKADDVPATTDMSRKVASNQVDLVFAMDCTSSMGKYIVTAQQVICFAMRQ
jgi:stress response protein SCP2